MESNTDGFTVTVSHGVATKTTLVEGFKTYWTYEDELTVFDAQLTNRCFAYRSSEDNGKTAVFETPEFIMPSEEHLATSPLVAVYPYNEALTFAYPEMTLTGLNIPAAQVAKADNFDPTATIALAFSNAAGKDNLTFNNLYSLLKLEVRKDDVKKVTVKANGVNDKLVGTGSIQFNQLGGYEFTMTEGTNEVVLSGEFVKDNTYYVAVAPGTYANGFSVYLDDTQVKTTTDSKTLQANYVYNLGNLKASRNLKFSAESVTVTLGDAFTAPELTGEKDGAVFTSSNEEVATVDETGAVTVIGVGETIISAMAAENESYLSGDASYTLTVKAPKVYLVPNDKWNEASARFAAYFFGAGETWVDMKSSAQSGVYEVEVPAGGYTTVIFCRMNPSATTNNWNTKWNQTGDMNIEVGKYCVIPPYVWDGSMVWSADKSVPFIQDGYYYLLPSSDWLQADARFAVYFCNGKSAAKWLDMEPVGYGTNYYRVENPTGENHKNIIFCRMNPSSSTNDWNNKWNQTADLLISGGNNAYIGEGWDGGQWTKIQ